MFVLLSHTEIFNLRVDPDKLMEVMRAHTHVKDRFTEKLFEGKVQGRKFDVVRYHQPIAYDLNVSHMKGTIRNNDGFTTLEVTYSLNLLHRLGLVAIIIFFIVFTILLKIFGNSADVTSLVLSGALCVVVYAGFYHFRFIRDRQAYKNLIKKIVIWSSAEYAAGL